MCSEELDIVRDKLALLLTACESSLELNGAALNGAARVLLDVIEELDNIIRR